MDFSIQDMTMEHYDAAFRLWERTEGVCLHNTDSRESIDKYLRHNKGFSFVALNEDEVVGTVLSGHDGRLGYIYHLAVATRAKNRGIGKALLNKCLESLREDNITRCHIIVRGENVSGKEFWLSQGWWESKEVDLMTIAL